MRVAPLVWVLQGKREGDNAQARELARRLGWPFEIRRLSYRVSHMAPNLLKPIGLATLDIAKSDALSPPWPDLIVGAGKRMVPVGRWIRAQSGGFAKLVAIGRPRAPLHWFDLVVTTPQYGLPAAGNVIELPLPFAVPVAPDPHALANWQNAFAGLPRPWVGVLVGGPTPPHRLGRSTARALAGKLNQTKASSFLVSTSPRTPAFVAETLEADVAAAKFIYRWNKCGRNPHQAILALCDRYIVTSDSVSMAAEAIVTGKPVEIFQLPRSALALSWNAKKGLPAWLARHGILCPPRDNRLVKLAGHDGGSAAIQRIRALMGRA